MTVTVRNQLKEMGFISRKAKCKPSRTLKKKKTARTVDDWVKVIFNDESPVWS